MTGAPLNTTTVESSSTNITVTDAPDGLDSNIGMAESAPDMAETAPNMDESASDADTMEMEINNTDEEFVDYYIKTHMDDSPEEDIQDDALDADDISGGKTRCKTVVYLSVHFSLKERFCCEFVLACSIFIYGSMPIYSCDGCPRHRGPGSG